MAEPRELDAALLARGDAEPRLVLLKALDELPSRTDKIPAFFFGHGSPALAFPKKDVAAMGEVWKTMGPTGPLAAFLEDFGPALLKKYKPKGIVVFSAHWESSGERLGMSSMDVPSALR